MSGFFSGNLFDLAIYVCLFVAVVMGFKAGCSAAWRAQRVVDLSDESLIDMRERVYSRAAAHTHISAARQEVIQIKR